MQHQLAVGPQDAALIVHHAAPVAVAVQRDAEFQPVAQDAGPQVVEVPLVAGIRMMVREIAVDIAVQRHHLCAAGTQDLHGNRSGDPIAGIQCDAHRAFKPDVACDAVDVGLRDVCIRRFAAVSGGRILQHALAQGLDRFAGEGASVQHQFEAVVLGRVVAAGDHDSGAGAQFASRVIQYGRGHLADAAHGHAAFGQSVGQSVGESGAGMAAVEADRQFTDVRIGGRDGAAQMAGEFGREFAPGDAAYVVGPEDVRGRPHHCRPLWPKPPVPRRLFEKSGTVLKIAWRTGTSTSCAMRSPTSTVNGSWPRFQQDTMISPW